MSTSSTSIPEIVSPRMIREALAQGHIDAGGHPDPGPIAAEINAYLARGVTRPEFAGDDEPPDQFVDHYAPFLDFGAVEVPDLDAWEGALWYGANIQLQGNQGRTYIAGHIHGWVVNTARIRGAGSDLSHAMWKQGEPLARFQNLWTDGGEAHTPRTRKAIREAAGGKEWPSLLMITSLEILPDFAGHDLGIRTVVDFSYFVGFPSGVDVVCIHPKLVSEHKRKPATGKRSRGRKPTFPRGFNLLGFAEAPGASAVLACPFDTLKAIFDYTTAGAGGDRWPSPSTLRKIVARTNADRLLAFRNAPSGPFKEAK